jgi:hypothetical protein
MNNKTKKKNNKQYSWNITAAKVCSNNNKEKKFKERKTRCLVIVISFEM